MMNALAFACLASAATAAQVGVSWSATSYSDIDALVAGDEVVFTYSSSHDVYKFNDKAAYEACDFNNATLLGGTRDSPYTYVMDGSESTVYLGCSKGSHCSRSGQEIALNLASKVTKSTQVGVSWSATSYNDITDLAVGDDVLFSYSSSHDVYQFNDKAAYDACDFGSATLLGDTRDSPYSFVMDGSESTVYLGCSKGSHCSRSGQKVALSLAGKVTKSAFDACGCSNDCISACRQEGYCCASGGGPTTPICYCSFSPGCCRTGGEDFKLLMEGDN